MTELTWQTGDTWIVATGVVCAMACALIGNFLVLRRMSMMSDTISHAVLPGLAITFIVTESRAVVPMFVGAVLAGILTTVLTQWINRFGQVERGAVMGIVFTTFFAAGLLLIEQAGDRVDLDPKCVLFGALELTALDRINLSLGPYEITAPRALIVLSFALILNLLFVAVCYKELRISSFDPELATTLGFNAQIMHYLLMVLVAVTAVAAFEAVGSILVIAMLIVPGATAYLLTDRLGVMIAASMAIAAFCAASGHLATVVLPQWLPVKSVSTSGMMATLAGLVFLVTALFAPRHGVIARRRTKLKRKPWNSERKNSFPFDEKRTCA